MLIIGLTGGIGSGKTTVANLFAKLDIDVIDADIIARELVAPRQPALTKIIEYFGKQILNADGSLDRRQLREIIFKDEQARHWLEKLLHPLIYQEIEKRAHNAHSPYCMVVIPLLLETGRHTIVKQVLVVDAPEAIQHSRVQERDKLSAAQVDAILKTQLPREQRLAMANQVINNSGSLAELEQQVLKLHQYYLQLANSSLA